VERNDANDPAIRRHFTDIQSFAVRSAIRSDNAGCKPKPSMMLFDATREDRAISGAVAAPSRNMLKQLLTTDDVDVVRRDCARVCPTSLDEDTPFGDIVLIPCSDVGENRFFDRQHGNPPGLMRATDDAEEYIMLVRMELVSVLMYRFGVCRLQ
jgi:hypothetical protein